MRFKNILLFLAISAVVLFIGAGDAFALTQVTGELKGNTTWTKANSPYEIVKTIEIPKKYTLTIEPGVVVETPSGFDMFKLKGKLIAIASSGDPIIFNGYGNSRFIDALGSDNIAFAEIEYAEIRDIKDLWHYGYGSFSLKNSIIENASKNSNVYYPKGDIVIEGNGFKNAAGFSFGLGSGYNAIIKNNLWQGKNAEASNANDFFLENWAALGGSRMIVENNTFLPADGIILKLGDDRESGIEAINNYWVTTDVDNIGGMVYDILDNSALIGEIIFTPFLSEQHVNTPALPTPAMPELNDYASSTFNEFIELSGTKAAFTAIVINNEEVAPADENEDWAYELSLEPGENVFVIQARDLIGILSEAITVNITREVSGEAGECSFYEYADWGVCLNGLQSREIVLASPEGCAQTNAVLSRACDETADKDFIAREKELTKNINKNLANRLSGKILLQVEENGEAWYIYPEDKKRYFLGRPADAFSVMRELGLGATHDFITSHTIYPSHVLGKILIDVDDHGKAYYINPNDKKAYFLGRPADAFSVMREQGLGITNIDLRKIEVGEIG